VILSLRPYNGPGKLSVKKSVLITLLYIYDCDEKYLGETQQMIHTISSQIKNFDRCLWLTGRSVCSKSKNP
jgi:hypothetical protein